MAEREVVVQVRGLKRKFGEGEAEVWAMRGIDLAIRRGEFVAVMGPSGSGKSTLLHTIAGLDAPSEGTIEIAGRALGALSDDDLTLLRRRQMGFIFQAFNLLEVLTAEENVALPLEIDGADEGEARSRAREALAKVGLAHRAGHRPSQLSGGEQQRVAIARALITRPVLLLADEPTGNLDTRNREQVTEILRRLAEEEGQTILMVTHDPAQGAAAGRVVLLRDGLIEEEIALPAGHTIREALARLESRP